MDPISALGAAGSIVGIVAFGLQLAGYVYKVQSKIRSAKESLRNILATINSTASALESLYTYVKLEQEGIAKRRGRLQLFSIQALIDLKDTADQCLIVFWRIEAAITGNKSSASEEELARKLVQFNKLLDKDTAARISLDNTIGDLSWSLFESIRWTYIDFKLDGYSQQLHHYQGCLTLMCSVVSLGELRTIGTHTENFRAIAEAYQILLSHKDIVIIASEFSQHQATQGRQSTVRPSSPNATRKRNSKMASKDTNFSRNGVEISSKAYDTRPSHDPLEQAGREPMKDKADNSEKDETGRHTPHERKEELQKPVVDFAEKPSFEYGSVTSHNSGVPPNISVENVPNLNGTTAVPNSSTVSTAEHRENLSDASEGVAVRRTGAGNIPGPVAESTFVQAPAKNNNNQQPVSGIQVDLQTSNAGHYEEEHDPRNLPSGFESQISAGKINAPQRRGSYREDFKMHREPTKTGSARNFEKPQKSLELKEQNRSRTLTIPNKTFEETNRVIIAAYKIAAGSAHLVPLYRHNSPWVPKGPWKSHGRRQVSLLWRSQFRVAHKSFLRTFSTMTGEDLDALEQILQDHGNDGSYPFLVDLKKMGGGWHFKSWTKNDCPAYLAVVEEHYYVEENSETSMLRVELKQHQRRKSSSIQGTSRPKPHYFKRDAIPQQSSHSSHSLISNRARQSIMETRGIQDVSDMLTLDEDSSDEESLSSREYRIFSIQPPTKDSSNWVRCTVREEPLCINDILQRIEHLDSDNISVIDKKLQLRSDQQAQVTRIHANIVTTETNPGMYWLLRQLQVMQKETSYFRKRGPDSGILVFFVREPRPWFEYQPLSHSKSRRYSPSTTTVAAANAIENNLSKPMENATSLPVLSIPEPSNVPQKGAHSPSIRSFERRTEIGKDTAAADTDSIPVIAVDVAPEREPQSSKALDVSGSKKNISKPSHAHKGSKRGKTLQSRVSKVGDHVYESRNLLVGSQSRAPSPSGSYDKSLSRLRYEAYSAGRKDQEKEDEDEEERERLTLQRYYGNIEARHQYERRDHWQQDPREQTPNEGISRRLRETTGDSQYFDSDFINEMLVIRALEHRRGKASERLGNALTDSEEREARSNLTMINSLLREAEERLQQFTRGSTLEQTDEDLLEAPADTLTSMELRARFRDRYPTYFDSGPFNPRASSPGAEGDAIDKLLLTWTPLNEAMDGSIKAVPRSSGHAEVSEQSETEQRGEEVADIQERHMLLPGHRGGGSAAGSLDSPILEPDTSRSHFKTTVEVAADSTTEPDAATQAPGEEDHSPQGDDSRSDSATNPSPLVAQGDSHHMHAALDADKVMDKNEAGSGPVEHQTETENESDEATGKEAHTGARAHQGTVPQDSATASAKIHLDRAMRLVRNTDIRSDPGNVEEEQKSPAGDDSGGFGRPGGFRLPRKSRTWNTREPHDRDAPIVPAERRKATRSEVAPSSERRIKDGQSARGNPNKLAHLGAANERSVSWQKEEGEYDYSTHRKFREVLKPRSRASQSIRWEDRGEAIEEAPEEVIRTRFERNYRDTVDAPRRERAAEQDEVLSRRAREEQLSLERHRREMSRLRSERRLEMAYTEAEEREREARIRRVREDEWAERLRLGLELGLELDAGDVYPELDELHKLQKAKQEVARLTAFLEQRRGYTKRGNGL